jgi:hypothetical protein
MPNRFKTALDIQDACNLTAVAGVFHKMCLEVLEETHSTKAVAQDPAILWMLDKMCDLTGRPDCVEMDRAYLQCHERSEGVPEERRSVARG